MKIAHIADTHIRNLNYHPEYRIVFDAIYDILRKEKVDCIVHCGDIAHTKTQISPEFVEMCSDFLKSLASIAPTFVILGNHDGNLKNGTRQDAITPIIKALNHPQLHLFKKSGEYPFKDIVFNVMSIFDEDNWKQPSDPNKINIALYHGSISGCDTDIGWTMKDGDNDISIFTQCDYALLGDIHRTNQVLDDDGRVRYAGSTIQQNHGETDDKGLLVWDIRTKTDFDVKHIAVNNPKPFLSIELEPTGKIPENLIVPSGARIRVIANNSFPLDTIRKTLDIVRTNYKPEHLTFVDKSEDTNSISELVDQFKKEDLRCVEVQERLIQEYLKDYKINEELLKRVFDINKKYNQLVENNETIGRNIDFKILKFEWDNLFNYGAKNSLDFTNLNGIVGVFGKNYSGKSSIIDSLLYTVYNSITKKSKKSVNIINLDSTEGSGKAWLKVGNNTYCIQRKSEKYLKKLHGVETVEAKTNVNFELIDPITGDTLDSYNGIDRFETDRNITKIFGSMDDFLLTSMSSQLGSLSYIDKGSTDRKENLARFLDLDFFAEKFKLANDDVSTLKASLKRFEGKDLEKDLENAQLQIFANETNTQKIKSECAGLKEQIAPLEKAIFVLEENIKKSPTEIIDIDEVQTDIALKEKKITTTGEEIASLESKLAESEAKNKKVREFIEKFDINSLKGKEKDIQQNEKLINSLLREIEDQTKTLNHDLKKVELLKHVPCGPEFSHCQFIKGAYEAKENIDIIKLVIKQKSQDKIDLDDKLKVLDPPKVKDQLDKYSLLLDKQNSFGREIDSSKVQIATKKSILSVLERDLDKLKLLEQEYLKNKDVIENYEGFLKEKKEKESELKVLKKKLDTCDKNVLDLYKNHGSLDQKATRITEDQAELQNLRESYEAYDLFLKCMHSNGISYDIIKKSLPTINNEIAKNLANIVDFEIYFQNEENRLELYIRRPNDSEALPIEMASVAQKMLGAMAIRLAFIHVSSLPKSDIFILDEPGTALDEDNMEGFIRMLDVIKSHFKCVLLISHLDSLKDTADTVLNIEKRGNFAYLSN